MGVSSIGRSELSLGVVARVENRDGTIEGHGCPYDVGCVFGDRCVE